MGNYRLRNLLYSTLLVLMLTLSLLPIDAQVVDQGRLVYIQNPVSGFQAVSYATGQATPVYDGRCLRFSPKLGYLARFTLDNPDQLTFFNLDSGLQETQVPWQTNWGQNMAGENCFATHWFDDQTFVLPNVQEPQQVYYIDRDTGTVSGPFAAEPPLTIPNRDLRSNIVAFSPSGRQVTYRRCDQTDCIGSTRFVVYDLSQQQVITELTGHGYVGGPPQHQNNSFPGHMIVAM